MHSGQPPSYIFSFHLCIISPLSSLFFPILFLISRSSIWFVFVVVVQSLSCVQLFATPWTAAHHASLSFTTSWSLLKLMSIESMMPSNQLILCHPLLLLASIFPSIRVFSNELALHIRWPKYSNFSFSISPSNEYSGLISFRIDWFDLPALQETFPPKKSSPPSKKRVFYNTAAQKDQFFRVQPSLWSNSHTHTWLLEKP